MMSKPPTSSRPTRQPISKDEQAERELEEAKAVQAAFRAAQGERAADEATTYGTTITVAEDQRLARVEKLVRRALDRVGDLEGILAEHDAELKHLTGRDSWADESSVNGSEPSLSELAARVALLWRADLAARNWVCYHSPSLAQLLDELTKRGLS